MDIGSTGLRKSFFEMAKARIIQLPDFETTGHKLHGMTKEYLVVSELNHSTANWIYVVLSRFTTLSGLFYYNPLKLNFKPQPSKLLQNEWNMQRNMEI